jgi:hypothetical protein
MRKKHRRLIKLPQKDEKEREKEKGEKNAIVRRRV